MEGHGRQALVVALATLTLATAAVSAEPPSSQRPDAQFNDVFFQGADRGWAVGDRGAIWATTNGGQTWHAQPSGTTARLESVWFVDAENGWAAGGVATPYTHVSTGVVLRTTDGGQKWSAETKTPLPRLCGIRMFDERGWAIGEGSSLFPSGVFSTTDSGRTWSAIAAGRFESWVSAGFSSPQAGVVVGQRARVARIERGRLLVNEPAVPPLASVRKVAMVSAQRGWLVGDRGLVRVTTDGGRTWQPPPGELPPLARECDFAAVSAREESVWIAGAPGSVVWHSADAGRTWSVHPTGQYVPIRSITFVDRHRGWAVGDLGTILATRDGGKSWRAQRRGGERAAVMAIFARPRDVPLPLVADLAANDGYLTVVNLLGRAALRDDAAPGDDESFRSNDALSALGAAATETISGFDLPREADVLKATAIIAQWDAANDGSAREALVKRLTRALRTWRPDVVITHAPGAADEGLGHFVNQAALAAVEQAAGTDVSNHDELARLGLGIWNVRKVYGLLHGGERGSFELATAKLSTRLGHSLADEAARAAGFFDRAFVPQPASVRLVQLVDRTAGGGGDLLSGIPAAGLAAARRTVSPSVGAPDGLRILKEHTAARRNAQALLEYARRRGDAPSGWLGRLDELTRGMDAASRAEVITQLAQIFEETGQWDLARELYGVLARDHAAQPLGQAALAWMVGHDASSEVRLRMRGHASYPVRQASAESVKASPIPKAKATTQLERLVERVDKAPPSLAAEPQLQLPLAVALRRAGDSREAQRRVAAIAAARPQDAWWSFAAGESWLAARKGKPPLPICKCRRVDERPRLDGKLDEEFWSSCEAAGLADVRHPQAGRPTEIRFAFDDENLYFSISARKAKTASYERDPALARKRDADLSERDRVIMFLDLDRDFVTHYRLTVDDRGWGADACGRDTTWDPRWFIAASADATSWTIEAAVPWRELTDSVPKAHDAWGVLLQRIVPGVGFQSLSPTADLDQPAESFGYLLFE
jgi:photosystem II stability/assembly factor-like uncharacterized protein